MDARTPARVHLTFAVTTAALVTVHLLSSGLARDLVVAGAALLAVGVVGWALVTQEFVHRPPWVFLWIGLVVLFVFVAVDAVGNRVPALSTTGPFFILTPVLAFALCVMIGASLLFHSNSRAVSATLDVGVFAISASVVAWVLLLAPLLEARGVPNGVQHATLVALLVLALAAGTVVTVARTIDEPNAALRYLVLAAATMAVALGGRALLALVDRPESAWAGPLWIVAFCAAAAAAVHPSASTMAAHPPRPSGQVTPGLLVGLGAALAAAPTMGMIQAVRGEPVPTIALGVGALAAIALVMLRIADLARTRAAAEHRLSRLAHYDELTGLANRRELDTNVEAALDRLDEGASAGVVAVFCDLDGFKDVNDAHGHKVGDDVLVVAARRLRAALRQDDVVARFGGDEFVVVAEGEPGRTEAETTRRIRAAFADPIRVGDVVAHLGTSLGAAVARPGEGVTATELLSAADAAMYRDKEAARRRRDPSVTR